MNGRETETWLPIAIGTTFVIAACGADAPSARGGDPVLAELDRLVAADAAPRFAATLRRHDSEDLSEGSSGRRTYADQEFRRIVPGLEKDALALERLLHATMIGGGCQLDGRYDGVEYDDFERQRVALFGGVDPIDRSRELLAGDRLPIVDEAGLWGEFVVVVREPGEPGRYELDRSAGGERDAIGAFTVDVPGDEFPGIGQIVLPVADVLDAAAVVADEQGQVPIDVTLRWIPGARSDARFNVSYEVHDERGELYINCWTRDDGEFTLPEGTRARLPETLTSIVDIDLERQVVEMRAVGDAVVFVFAESAADLL